MRLAINALSARTGGGVVYLKNLIRELAGEASIDEILVFARADMGDQLASRTLSSVTRVDVRIHGALHRLLYEQICLPIALARLRIDVLFAPAEIAPVFASCPVVLGLQNAIVGSKLPRQSSFSARLRNSSLYLLAWISVRKARELIFVSETARQNTSQVLGIDPLRGHVVYHGVDPLFLECAASTDGRANGDRMGPILYVGAVAPHKNLECLIDAFGMLGSETQKCHQLRLIGPIIDAQYGMRIVDMLHHTGLDIESTLLGSVPHHELPSRYRSASAFVLPSVMETFGLPLIEAMTCGAPVIAADASCLPEIVRDAGLLFDANDPRKLAQMIELVLADRNLQAELVKKGMRRAKEFRWSIAAASTLEILQQASQSRAGYERGAD